MTSSLEILKRSALRKTPFRIKVLDLFMGHPHAAIKNIDVEHQLGDFDRITLYRTLKTFEEKGIIHQVVDGSKEIKYALCHQDCQVHTSQNEHAHFACLTCGVTFCLDHEGEVNFNLPPNYSLKKVQLMLSGTCGKCNGSL